MLAYVNDTRSGNQYDELYTRHLDGGEPVALGGAEVNPSYAGFSTAWVHDGMTIAFGDAFNYVNPDSTEHRVLLVSANGSSKRVLYDSPMAVEYASIIPDSGWVVEGYSTTSSLDGVWVAFSVVTGAPNSEENGFYVALARADRTGGVDVVGEGFGHLAFSGNGRYLFFTRLEESDFYVQNIYQVDLDTGDVLNMSALSLDPGSYSDHHRDGVGCWLQKN